MLDFIYGVANLRLNQDYVLINILFWLLLQDKIGVKA